MTQSVADILEKAERLTTAERAELADRLVESLANEISPDVEAAHLTEVRRRIREVESGYVSLTPGEEVMAHAGRIVASARAAG